MSFNSVLNVKALVGNFTQEKTLVVITNIRVDLPSIEALKHSLPIYGDDFTQLQMIS